MKKNCPAGDIAREWRLMTPESLRPNTHICVIYTLLLSLWTVYLDRFWLETSYSHKTDLRTAYGCTDDCMVKVEPVLGSP